MTSNKLTWIAALMGALIGCSGVEPIDEATAEEIITAERQEAVESNEFSGSAEGTVFQSQVDVDKDGLKGRAGSFDVHGGGPIKRIDARIDVTFADRPDCFDEFGEVTFESLSNPECDVFGSCGYTPEGEPGLHVVPSGKVVFAWGNGQGAIIAEFDGDEFCTDSRPEVAAMTIIKGVGAFAGASGTAELRFNDDTVLHSGDVLGFEPADVYAHNLGWVLRCKREGCRDLTE